MMHRIRKQIPNATEPISFTVDGRLDAKGNSILTIVADGKNIDLFAQGKNPAGDLVWQSADGQVQFVFEGPNYETAVVYGIEVR
jgi:hypothetical protein